MPFPFHRPVRLSILAGLCFTLAGCHVPVPETVYSSCKAIATANWKARMERGVRNGLLGAPRILVVEGDVTLPTGGYALSLDKGALQRNDPYYLQVHLRTNGQSDSATQAVTTQHVVGRMTVGERFEGVHIRCGDALIAEIPQIAPLPSA
jgi:hypothetical protein